MKSTLQTAGRVLFALPFAVFGLNHFIFAKGMAGMVPAFVPGGIFWIYFTGAALIAAAVSIIAQKQARLASILLAGLLLTFVLTIHLPGLAQEASRMFAMVGLLKDLSLAGSALLVAAQASAPETVSLRAKPVGRTEMESPELELTQKAA